MDSRNGPTTIVVSDLYFAAYLRTLDVEIKLIAEGSDDRAHFVFESDTYDLSKLMEQFYLGELRCDPNRFGREWRVLRTMINPARREMR